MPRTVEKVETTAAESSLGGWEGGAGNTQRRLTREILLSRDGNRFILHVLLYASLKAQSESRLIKRPP